MATKQPRVLLVLPCLKNCRSTLIEQLTVSNDFLLPFSSVHFCHRGPLLALLFPSYTITLHLTWVPLRNIPTKLYWNINCRKLGHSAYIFQNYCFYNFYLSFWLLQLIPPIYLPSELNRLCWVTTCSVCVYIKRKNPQFFYSNL